MKQEPMDPAPVPTGDAHTRRQRGHWSERLRSQFVGLVYADHNRSQSVQREIRAQLANLPADGVGLNVGAGGTRLDPRVKNLDVCEGPGIDIVAPAERIPLPADSMDLVITQETLEHVADPIRAMAEITRVLKPGGTLYLQVPFTIGYHPGPHDYWRFSREGIVQLAESSGLKVTRLGMVVGPSTGYYRISVEHFAILGSLPWAKLYIPLKAALAALLYPLKWLDVLTTRSPQSDRIAGGYYVLASKAGGSESSVQS